MDQGQRAVLIVAMLGDAARALTGDADVEQVICHGLGRGLHADIAACYDPDGAAGASLISCLPEPQQAARLVAAVGELWHPDRRAPLKLSHDEFGDVLVVVPAGVDHDGGAPRRGLAFARRDGFGEDHEALLHEAIPPLTALLPHAIAATERRERSRAGQEAAREYGLTSREVEVLQLLAEGLLATSIASRLSLSPRTVHKHLGNIYDKLGVHDRLVAVSLARGRGLVASDS